MIWCNVLRIRLKPLKKEVLNFRKKISSNLNVSIKMDNMNLRAEKSVKFLSVIFGYQLMFEEHIKSKIHNSRYGTSNFYSLKSHQYMIPERNI